MYKEKCTNIRKVNKKTNERIGEIILQHPVQVDVE